MKSIVMTTAAVALSLLGTGCATKKYVAQTVDPVSQKLDRVDEHQQTTQKQLDAAEPRISAADEKATSADNRATDAIGRADAASKKADQVRSDLRAELNDRIANLDVANGFTGATVVLPGQSGFPTSEHCQPVFQ